MSGLVCSLKYEAQLSKNDKSGGKVLSNFGTLRTGGMLSRGDTTQELQQERRQVVINNKKMYFLYTFSFYYYYYYYIFLYISPSCTW
jgi:hypothetical protein